ncbi:MAG: alpha/beta hydrolase, partial [Chloroflexota bacterium]
AHSMGNRVMLSAFADNVEKFRNSQPRIGQIIFSAADVYVDIFQQKFPKMSDIGLTKTSYVHQNDLALLASRLFNQTSRIGRFPEDSAEFHQHGLETIDVTPVSEDSRRLSLNHGYPYGNARVLTDLEYLLKDRKKAEDRGGLKMAPNNKYWVFK